MSSEIIKVLCDMTNIKRLNQLNHFNRVFSVLERV